MRGKIFVLAVIVALILSMTVGALSVSASGGYQSGCSLHHIRYGETLYSIGRHYGVNPYSIALANNLYNANYIQAGRYLCVPNYGYGYYGHTKYDGYGYYGHTKYDGYGYGYGYAKYDGYGYGYAKYDGYGYGHAKYDGYGYGYAKYDGYGYGHSMYGGYGYGHDGYGYGHSMYDGHDAGHSMYGGYDSHAPAYDSHYAGYGGY